MTAKESQSADVDDQRTNVAILHNNSAKSNNGHWEDYALGLFFTIGEWKSMRI